MLTYIYGTAFDNFWLGTAVIFILLPVHILYYYLLGHYALPQFFRGSYFITAVVSLFIMAVIAVVYRLVEIFVTDPYIYRFYSHYNPAFTWSKLDADWWGQLTNKGDFVNAVERSNVVVWIGLTVKMFALWHERKQAVLQAELSALKGQLHPHFLFNSLNNLYALSLDKAPQTPEIILGLSNILRYVIYECNAERVQLHREIEILQDYIRLEKLRYEDRLDLNVNLETQPDTLQITPLLMLPLIENAFKHGVSETVDNPWINIDLQVQQDRLWFKISNSKSHQPSCKDNSKKGNIGLLNVQHRLRILYPDRHKLEWTDTEDCFIIEMVVPLQNKQIA